MKQPSTRIDAIGESLFRISTTVPPDLMAGGFTFNQFLLIDDSPLLFHTGLRHQFVSVVEAISSVLPIERLRYISFPDSQPICSQVAAMTSIGDLSSRPPLVLAEDETRSLGKHVVKWIDAPHVPHGWENGFLFEETTRTLFCGDLFTQGGSEHEPLGDDILETSEQMRAGMDYFAHGPNTRSVLERLASLEPRILACMHGSAYQGDGGTMLRKLADRLGA
jgi:flavorubredoxin